VQAPRPCIASNFQNPAATKKIKDGFKYTKKNFFKALTHKNEKEKQEKKGK
jgi:hypothetical protein